MERGVAKSRKTLAVLTPAYLNSEWAEIENIMSQTLGPANRARRLIPLLKQDCQAPLRIAALTHIDFRDGADLELAWRQLLTALSTLPLPPSVEQPSRDRWFLAHPYAMPPNFTGRVAEREMLTNWLTRDIAHPLFVLRALGGFGKSALTWHWLLHDVDPAKWPRAVWWSFYEPDGRFDGFVVAALHYLSGESDDVPLANRLHVDALLRQLRFQGTLVVLDGFERELRAFAGFDAAAAEDDTGSFKYNDRHTVSPLAERFLRGVAALPDIHGRVLITSRLRPSPVETSGGLLVQGTREEELKELQPTDAVTLFRMQGIRGSRAEIEAACYRYGYHPLSLQLLTGLIVGDLQQPGDIAAAYGLDVSGDQIQRQRHVLEQAYDTLDVPKQKLLSLIACFRGAVSFETLKAVEAEFFNDQPTAAEGVVSLEKRDRSLDAAIRHLISRGLVRRELKSNRCNVHAIVRRYAYARLTELERFNAHARLRTYFASLSLPDNLRTPDDLASVIELFHHTVRSGRYDDANTLFFDRIAPLAQHKFGAYQLCIDLLTEQFPERDESSRPQVTSDIHKSFILQAVGQAYACIGQPGLEAIDCYQRALTISEELQNRIGVDALLQNLCEMQWRTGDLATAETNLRRTIQNAVEGCDVWQEVARRHRLSFLLALRGAWSESATELKILTLRGLAELEPHAITWSDRAFVELLRLRCASAVRTDAPNILNSDSNALNTARDALVLMEARTLLLDPSEPDRVRVHWTLGAVERAISELSSAERHLHQALERGRRINLVEVESDVLIDLGRLRLATGELDEVQPLIEEALLITERSGYVLQGADAHLVLAGLAKARGEGDRVHEHASEALKLATCNGPPHYTYAAAYAEAKTMLREVKADAGGI